MGEIVSRSARLSCQTEGGHRAVALFLRHPTELYILYFFVLLSRRAPSPHTWKMQRSFCSKWIIATLKRADTRILEGCRASGQLMCLGSKRCSMQAWCADPPTTGG